MSTFVFLIGVYTGCTTHLDEHASGPATSQRDAALYIVNANYPNNPRIVGGDFNLQSADMSNWTSGYWDVDPYWQNTDPAASPTQKIDWSFADKSTFPSTRITPSPYCNDYYSDHCYLRGYWIIP